MYRCTGLCIPTGWGYTYIHILFLFGVPMPYPGTLFFLTSSDFFPHKFYKAERCGTEMDTHTHCTLVCVCMMLAHFYLSSRCLLLLLSQQQQNFAASSAPCFFFLFFIIPHHFEVRWGNPKQKRRRSGYTQQFPRLFSSSSSSSSSSAVLCIPNNTEIVSFFPFLAHTHGSRISPDREVSGGQKKKKN